MRRSRLRRRSASTNRREGGCQQRLNPVRKWRYEPIQATIDTVARQTGTDPRSDLSARMRSRTTYELCPKWLSMKAGPMFSAVRQRSDPEGQTCGDVGQQTQPMGRLEAAELAWRDCFANCATTHDPRTAGKCQIADVFILACGGPLHVWSFRALSSSRSWSLVSSIL
jgi:hypothetical protein